MVHLKLKKAKRRYAVIHWSLMVERDRVLDGEDQVRVSGGPSPVHPPVPQ